MTQKTFPIGISLNPKLIDLIDEKRGLVPRSRFIAKLVSDVLEGGK